MFKLCLVRSRNGLVYSAYFTSSSTSVYFHNKIENSYHWRFFTLLYKWFCVAVYPFITEAENIFAFGHFVNK